MHTMLLIPGRRQRLCRALAGAGFLLLAAASFAAERPAVELPTLQWIEPPPELPAKAEALQMPISGWDEATLRPVFPR